MNPFRFAVLSLSLAALIGCAAAPTPRSAMLTYETSPPGATLYEGGKAIGVEPVTRTYLAEGQAATIRTPDVTAVWPSGAKESYYTLLPLGADRVATIERPAAALGLAADQENGKKVAAARAQEARRIKEAQLREQARNSDRCKAQAAGASRAVSDDCS